MTLLGLYKDEPFLTHNSFQFRDDWRKWELSRIGTFGCNLAFVLYEYVSIKIKSNSNVSVQTKSISYLFSCNDTGKSVALLHQERLVTIPGCPENKPCPLSLLEKLVPSTEEECHYEETCGAEE